MRPTNTAHENVPMYPVECRKIFNNCRNLKSISIKNVLGNSCFPQSHASDCGIVSLTTQSRWQPCFCFLRSFELFNFAVLMQFSLSNIYESRKSANTLNKCIKNAVYIYDLFTYVCVCGCAWRSRCLFYEKCIWLSSKCKFCCCLSASEYCDFIAWDCKYVWDVFSYIFLNCSFSCLNA